MVTIRPACCSSITRPTRWQVRNTPVRLTPMVRCQTARPISSAGVGSSDSPAAATRPSIRPAVCSTCCTAASIEASDEHVDLDERTGARLGPTPVQREHLGAPLGQPGRHRLADTAGGSGDDHGGAARPRRPSDRPGRSRPRTRS